MKLKINKTFYIVIMIICCFFFQTSAYSLLNSSLTITGNAIARIRNNVRINDFKIHEVSDGVISSYEEFSKTNTNSNVTLPNSDSYIIYKLVIGNYENVEMQLSNITGLSSNLTYELIDYSLHDMICDVTNKCTSGAEKTIYLKIKYASYDSLNTNYNVNLNYEFNEFSNVLMTGNEFSNIIPATATHLVFTDEKPEQGTVLTDVSSNQDMGVVGYLDGTTYKISTRRIGVKAEANADSSYMFNGSLLTDIDLDNLDIFMTTNIEGMFQDCVKLVNINFGNDWDTSNINGMNYLFKNCSSLSTIDLSGFNTGRVASFIQFFFNCTSLVSVDVSGFDTSSSTSFRQMFEGCSLLEVIDVSGFDTSHATDMRGMFSECSSVKILDVSGFDTKNVITFDSMFRNCFLVEELKVDNFVTDNTSIIQGMFWECKSLKSLNIKKWDVSNINSLYALFYQCDGLTSLDLSDWNVKNVTISYWVFEGSNFITHLDLSNWNFEKEVDFAGMFHGMDNLQTIDMSGWSAIASSTNSMFAECHLLEVVDLSGVDISSATTTERMFLNNYKLKKIYVGTGWDMSNVTASTNMFFNCVELLNFDSNYTDNTKAYIGDGGYLSSKYKTVVIDNVQYTYEDGMTWGEWLESKYNTGGFVSDGIYIIFPNESCIIVRYDPYNYSSFVTDTIDSNKEYYRRSTGCISGCSGGCN